MQRQEPYTNQGCSGEKSVTYATEQKDADIPSLAVNSPIIAERSDVNLGDGIAIPTPIRRL